MWLDGPLRDPTFGVELEFLIRHVPPQNGRQDLYQPPIREELRKHLKREGVRVNSAFNSDDAGYSVWQVDDDPTIHPYGDGDDKDLENDIRDKVALTSVELISRVLPVSQEGFQEVRWVVGLVRAKFDVKVNRSTGLHVHAGNGPHGFSDQCLQNLAQLVTVFQHQIESLHPDDRTNAYWAMPPSSNIELPFPDGPFAVAEALQFDDRNTIPLFNPMNDRYVAYNLTNLADPAVGSKRTIEFRQHQGSVNAGQIVAWAEFVTALVSYCHSISPERFMRLILRFGTDRDFSVLHLMQIIGKPHLVQFYQGKLYRRERPPVALPNPPIRTP
ncbi:MAG: hypothetical protein LQ347_003032 [Umbilicaria vellea]|nr:MAG: hypothetical protein LQ347_003032 [Umbilicaria vellea]